MEKKETEFDPKEAFLKIQKKAESLGLSPADLGTLACIADLRAPRKAARESKRRCGGGRHAWQLLGALTAALVALLLGSYTVQWPLSHQTLAQWWFNWYDMDYEKEACIVNIHEYVMDFTRPPVDCSACAAVTQVDRVRAISPEQFEERYAYTGRPVVIEDGAQNWTAPKTFTFDFFKNIYTEDSPVLENNDANCQFFPYKTNFNNLGEVFNMSKERAQMKDGFKPWYIGWSNCDSSAANILRKYYDKPYFLPKVAESSKTDWIFMGSPNYGAHLHIDNVLNPSWQAQITGTKKWTLEPPPECHYECPAQRMEVTVNPGEIIVLDTNKWFHSTLIVGKEMSITIGSEYD